MSNRVFTWCVDLESASASNEFNVLTAGFGDGYEQNTSVGINNRKQEWSITKTAKKSLITTIKNFFDDHKGADSFLWQSPFDGQIRVRAASYTLTPLGGEVWRISTSFSQVFYP